MESVAQLEAAAVSMIARVDLDSIAECRLIKISANRPPWTPSGIRLSAGERVSVFLAGRASIAEAPEIWVGAHFTLWMRIDTAGEIFRAPSGGSYTFTAAHGGELFLGSLCPGDWADRSGGLSIDTRAWERAIGTLAVLIVRWKVEPAAGLERLADAHPAAAAMLHAEAVRLRRPPITPPGWHYMWSIGNSGIFDSQRSGAGEPLIKCCVRDDAAILQRPIHAVLDGTTRLRWRWKIDTLPSSIREDSVPSHDYVSVAVEFDNGQDLTYMWSAALEPESAFRCPIPRWSRRETHMAIRCGQAGLGAWVSEERKVREDYRRAIGSPPAAIVAVWLIAVGIFSHTTCQCEYAGLELATGDRMVALI